MPNKYDEIVEPRETARANKYDEIVSPPPDVSPLKAGGKAAFESLGGAGGALAGGELGAAIGSFGGPIGTVVGGLGGALLGGYAGSELQEKAGQYVPQKVKEATGFTPEQRAAERQAAPTSTFVGGIAPDVAAAGPTLGRLLGYGYSGVKDIGQLLLGKKTAAQQAALQKEAQALGGSGKQALTAEEAAQQQRLAAAQAEKQRGVTEAVSRGLSETATQEQLAEIAKKAGLKAETQSALGLRELPGVRTMAEGGQFKPVPMTASEIGGYIREQAEKFLSSVKNQRNAAADKNFGAAKDVAKSLESQGKFVDTKPIVAQLDSLLAKGGTSDYLRSINQLKQDIQNTKSFEGLEVIRRRLGDAAYGAPEEGYKAIGQQFSGDMYKALSDQMKGYSKDFAKYLDDYKRLSKTIEAYGTKVGKGITETQDAAGKYYVKTAEQVAKDIFSSPEKYRMFVDSVGGNKEIAEAAARRYFAGLAEKAKTPEKIKELIQANRAILNEFDFVRKEIESRYLAPLVKAETRSGAAAKRIEQTEEAKKIAQERAREAAKSEQTRFGEVQAATSEKTTAIKAAQKTFSDSVQALANAKPGDAIRTLNESVLPKIREAENTTGVTLLSKQQEQALRQQVQQLEFISDKTEKTRIAAKIIGGLTIGYAGTSAVGKATGLLQ